MMKPKLAEIITFSPSAQVGKTIRSKDTALTLH